MRSSRIFKQKLSLLVISFSLMMMLVAQPTTSTVFAGDCEAPTGTIC